MKILKLEIKNFRNIKEAVVIPFEEMNVICGENAQGKTNLLEAIWLFTGAKSFRGAKDNEYVLFNEKNSSIKLSFLSEGIEKEAEIEIYEKRNAFINGKKLKSASLLAGNFYAIVFSPTDLSILNDGPAVRRKFLDIAIGQLYPSYIETLRKYLKAVAQRNKILKDYKYDSTLSVMLDVFEDEIAQEGKKIIEARKKYINLLNQFLPDIYKGISREKENLETVYKTNCDENLKEQLFLSRKEDMFKGATTVGPHRDDISFKINNISARSFGSQGQKRSVALSLKLAEAEVIKKNVGECPVFLLDDVMSELDPERQNFILNHIKGMQVFLSCCDPSNIKQLKKGRVFEVKEGVIS